MNMAMTFSNEMKVMQKISAWENQAQKKTPRLVSFIAALLFHAFFFFIGGFIFIKAPDYGMDMNQGGVDIFLVAAPANSVALAQVQPLESIPQRKDEIKTQSAKLIKSAIENSAPGRNAVTFSSSGNGQVEEKPGYLKNPPPAYPSEAVQKGQEGLVLLSVMIDRTGQPLKVALKQSSGFYLLDESAVKAVKKWKFRPARTGAQAVETQDTIPVRFRLENIKKHPKKSF